MILISMNEIIIFCCCCWHNKIIIIFSIIRAIIFIYYYYNNFVLSVVVLYIYIFFYIHGVSINTVKKAYNGQSSFSPCLAKTHGLAWHATQSLYCYFNLHRLYIYFKQSLLRRISIYCWFWWWCGLGRM